MPKSYRRRRRHRRRASHKDKKERLTENASDKSDTENNDEASNSILKPLSKFWWTPCQGLLEPVSVFPEGFSPFQKKGPYNSLWPHRSCWVHLVARNNHACPLSDECAGTEQGEFSLEIMVTQITVAVLMWVSWVQCLSACLPVLLSLVVDISVSFFVCVRPCLHLYVLGLAVLGDWSVKYDVPSSTAASICECSDKELRPGRLERGN